MHEFDLPEAGSPRLRSEHPSDANAVAHEDAEPPRQREGLPSRYRMRAERHYVDQLMSPVADAPMRMIRVTELWGGEDVGVAPGDALSRSIRAHGVIQPLLVRRVGAAYHIIAGKKRLAAAAAAGVEQVPCIVHDVDDDGAAGLRTAEALRAEGAPALRAVVGAKLADSILEIAGDFSRMQTTLALLREPAKPFQKAVAIDLLAAQAWRGLWSANLAALLAGGKAPAVRQAPLAAVVDQVLQGFEPECRLSRLRLSALYHGSASIVVDEAVVGFALTTAIIVTTSLFDDGTEPALEVHSHRLGDEGLWLEVVQRQSVVSAQTAALFSNGALSAPGRGALALGALALAHATAAFGGAAELIVTADPGSSLRLTFTRL